ncbi:TPA: acyl-CoA dehydrogenase, partial [Raoultella ornithinolytica]|nr:acyl-CoA dehydrogenase [Raoultella ornithinolytica]
MTLSGQQPLRPQADWLRQLTHIRQQMAEQAAELDRSGDFPHHNLALLHQSGFLSLA